MVVNGGFMIKKITSLLAICFILLPSIMFAESAHDPRQLTYRASGGGVDKDVLCEEYFSSCHSAFKADNIGCDNVLNQILSLTILKTRSSYIIRESLEPSFKFSVFSKGAFF